MERTARRVDTSTSTRYVGSRAVVPVSDLLGLDWTPYIGAGMTPEMQVLWDAARRKGQVR